MLRPEREPEAEAGQNEVARPPRPEGRQGEEQGRRRQQRHGQVRHGDRHVRRHGGVDHEKRQRKEGEGGPEVSPDRFGKEDEEQGAEREQRGPRASLHGVGVVVEEGGGVGEVSLVVLVGQRSEGGKAEAGRRQNGPGAKLHEGRMLGIEPVVARAHVRDPGHDVVRLVDRESVEPRRDRRPQDAEPDQDRETDPVGRRGARRDFGPGRGHCAKRIKDTRRGL